MSNRGPRRPGKKPVGNLGLGRLKSSPAESSPRKPQQMMFEGRQKAFSFNSCDGEADNIDPVKSLPIDLKSFQQKHKAKAAGLTESFSEKMGNLVFGDKAYPVSRADIEDKGKIGNGVTGDVYKVLHRHTGQLMAAKKMIWVDEREEQKRVMMDLNVMSVHMSPHIVTYYGSAIWNNEVWVFMELMTTCLQRLFNRLQSPLPEDIVCKMAVSIVKALHYLKQEHKVIHRDVKPSNMLLDREGNVKLCDFGISGRLVDSQAFTRNAGCAAFMAPERINIQNGGYDIRADIWSLGISLVQLVTGTLPYADKKFGTEFELLTHIVQAPPPLPCIDDFSPNFYDFLSQCLSKDVTARPHYAKLLEHPLILEYEIKPVDVGAWLRDVEKTVGL